MKPPLKKKRLFIQFLVLLLLVGSLFLWFRNKRETLQTEFMSYLQEVLEKETGFEIRVGSVEGRILGGVVLRDLEIRQPWLPAGQATLLRADEIQFRYRLLDFLSKKFDSKVDVYVKRPELHWTPEVRLRKPEFPFLNWMRDWAVSQAPHIRVRIKGMTFLVGYGRKRIEGIDLEYEEDAFKMTIPVSHVTFAGSDVSSVVTVEGQLEPVGPDLSSGLKGRIRTEGTVINWAPLAEESSFDFIFSEDFFSVVSSDFLGGIEVKGGVNFTRDFDLDLSVRASGYALSHLSPFLRTQGGFSLEGEMDLDLRFYGSPWSPGVEGRLRLDGDWLNARDLKAMDLQVSGVYPTVQLRNSRFLLKDGSTMRFAEKTIEVKDLFHEDTYSNLVQEAQQDTVVWGNWEFMHSRGVDKEPEFLMKRVLGDNTRMSLRETVERRDLLGLEDDRQMEVGFEYRLKSQDSLKLEFREDEEFVGVERKIRF